MSTQLWHWLTITLPILKFETPYIIIKNPPDFLGQSMSFVPMESPSSCRYIITHSSDLNFHLQPYYLVFIPLKRVFSWYLPPFIIKTILNCACLLLNRQPQSIVHVPSSWKHVSQLSIVNTHIWGLILCMLKSEWYFIIPKSIDIILCNIDIFFL